ncbi:MAG: PqqD family protein [Solirubrobacteraceae bacterium]|jgi:hypothetical protein
MSEKLRLREAGLEWRTVDGEVVALDVAASAYLAVNESGRLLWEALGAGTTRGKLIELLTANYGLDRTVAERDIDEFLAELGRRGLLEAQG